MSCTVCGGLLGRRIGWQGVDSCTMCGRDFDAVERELVVICGIRPHKVATISEADMIDDEEKAA